VGSNKDAGDTFSEALDLKPGKESAELSFSDDIDVYMFDVPRNKEVKIRVIPPEDKRIGAVLYNEDKALYQLDDTITWVKELTMFSLTPGQVVEYHYLTSKSQTFYLTVESYEEYANPLGKYEIELNVIEPKKETLEEIKQEREGRTPFERQSGQVDDTEVPLELGFLGLFMDILGIGYLAIVLLFFFIFIISAILVIYCLINILSAQNETTWKLVWTLIILFFGPLGAIVYLIIGKKHRNKQSPSQPPPPELGPPPTSSTDNTQQQPPFNPQQPS
jgi:hypothetical protein